MQIMRFIITLSVLTVSLTLCAENSLHRYQLKNGLTILVKEDHRAPVAMVMVGYKIGSAYESAGTTGLSHMLEHMMFKGTPRYPAGRYLQLISENGGDSNATTNSDFTNYYQEVATDRLPLIFELEADRMHNLSLDENTFTKEMQVVQEERYMRTDDNPQGLTYERFMAAAHLAFPYHHPVIGWMSDLKHMTIEDLRQWYKTWYTPNNATLVVVGDVSPQAIYQLAEKYFGPLPSTPLPKVKPQPEPPSLGTRAVVVATPAKLPWLIMGYSVPVLKTTDKPWETYALLLTAGILDGGNSARLEKSLVRGKQLASDIGVNYSPFQLLATDFVLEGTPTNGHSVHDLKNALLEQIKILQTTLVKPDELKRVKNQIIAERVYEKDSIDNQALNLMSLESVGLSADTDAELEKNINAITPEQIQSVAKLYFQPERLTVAELNPLPISKDVKNISNFSAGASDVH